MIIPKLPTTERLKVYRHAVTTAHYKIETGNTSSFKELLKHYYVGFLAEEMVAAYLRSQGMKVTTDSNVYVNGKGDRGDIFVFYNGVVYTLNVKTKTFGNSHRRGIYWTTKKDRFSNAYVFAKFVNGRDLDVVGLIESGDVMAIVGNILETRVLRKGYGLMNWLALKNSYVF